MFTTISCCVFIYIFVLIYTYLFMNKQHVNNNQCCSENFYCGRSFLKKIFVNLNFSKFYKFCKVIFIAFLKNTEELVFLTIFSAYYAIFVCIRTSPFRFVLLRVYSFKLRLWFACVCHCFVPMLVIVIPKENCVHVL